jgi:3-methyl-2-oxobutanoate hydroxymethyltransferase
MSMAQAIDRGSKYGLRMVDMPYWSFHSLPEQAVENAGRFHEAGAEVMKREGNQHHAKAIEAIVKAGIPAQGHIGITPMRMPQLGGFRAQGKTADRAKELVGCMGDGGRGMFLHPLRGDDRGSVPVLGGDAPGAGDFIGGGE